MRGNRGQGQGQTHPEVNLQSLTLCLYAGVTAGLPKAASELLALFLLTQKGA